MKFKFILAVSLVLLLSSFAWGFIINEVSYASDIEWIELYNPENSSYNLTGWSFADENSEDELVCCKFQEECKLEVPAFGYLLIGNQKGPIHSAQSSQICVDDNSLGNGLHNKEDTLYFFNETHEAEFIYTLEMGGKKPNTTLERDNEDLWGESFFLGGTPGYANTLNNFSIEFENLIISEIMADPFYEDNAAKPGGEWVELYNSGDTIIDLRGLRLTDEKYENELFITDDKIIREDGLLLYPDQYIVIYRDKDSDFALNNNGYDEVNLYIESNLIDTVSFPTSTEGMSWSNIESEWYQTPSSPSSDNLIEEFCDWMLHLDFDNAIFKKNDLEFLVTTARNFGFEQNITIRGEITDVNGHVVKSYSPWTDSFTESQKSKSYSPNLPEGIYQISFWYDNLTCSDLDETDNFADKLIAVNDYYKDSESSVEIERLYLGNDNKAEWGDQFTVKINAYKGDETRESMQVWVEKGGEKVSKTSRVLLEEPFTKYPLTIPVQLKPNCNNKISDGKATLKVKVFDLEDSQNFKIKGVDPGICREYLDYLEENEIKLLGTGLGHEIISAPATLFAGDVGSLEVRIANSGQVREYTVWAYAYRGSKCYSCSQSTLERDVNKQKITLRENEIKILNFDLKLDEGIKVGDYKIKVKIKKDSVKTTKDLTKKFKIIEKEKIVNLNASENSLFLGSVESTSFAQPSSRVFGQTGLVVYESSSVKARKMIPLFMFLSFVLIVIVLFRNT